MSRIMQNQVLRSLHQPSQAFFSYDTNYRIVLCSLHRLYFIVGVMPKKRLARAGASQAFFLYDIDKDLKTCFWATQLT